MLTLSLLLGVDSVSVLVVCFLEPLLDFSVLLTLFANLNVANNADIHTQQLCCQCHHVVGTLL